MKINPAYLRHRFLSDRGRFLKNKQILKRFFYGLRERQLQAYIVRAAKRTRYVLDSMSIDFLSYLEKRLDSLLWRSGFFTSARYLRQVIRHNYIKVNGVAVSYPSYVLDVGDKVTLDSSIILRLFNFLFFSSRRFYFFLLRFLKIVFFPPLPLSSSVRKREYVFWRFVRTLYLLRRRNNFSDTTRKLLFKTRSLKRAGFSVLRWLRFRQITFGGRRLFRGLRFLRSISKAVHFRYIYRFAFLSSFFKGRFFQLLRLVMFPFRMLLFNFRVFTMDASSLGLTIVFRPQFFKYPFPMEVRILFNLYTGFF